MTVTNTRVILHTPKTAGSSIRWPAINIDGLQYSCQHCKYEMLPEQYKDMRKITFVRNPYDWYASRYFFDKKRDNNKLSDRNDIFTSIFSNNFELTFKETLPFYMNLTETFRDKFILNRFKNALKYQVTNNYQCWLVSYWDNIEDIKPEDFENKSLYQWWLDIVGVDKADAWYRIEDQHEEGMKKEFGENVNIIHKNKSHRPNTNTLYTDDMKHIVYEADKNIFIRYGYEK